MNLTCGREELLEAIMVCQRAISAKSMLPILSGVLFKSDKKTLNLSATDLEISIRKTLNIEAKEGGAVVIPARLITDILSSLETENVELSLIKDKAQLELKAGDSKFTLNVYFEEDFPKIPEAEKGTACTIKSADFNKATKEVVKAASRDEGKPVLTGALVEITKDTLRMVATDSYRLALCETGISEGPAEDISIIVPAKSLRELSRIISAKSGGSVSISLTENQAIFKTDETELISRLIDGEFPNYKQIIPEGYEKVIKMDREKATGCIRRTAILAQNNAPIRFTATNGQAVISSSTQDVGEAIEKMEIEYSGDEIKMAFNHEYLLDGITSVDEESVALEVTDPLKPAMVKPVKDKSFQYLIMPVRLT